MLKLFRYLVTGHGRRKGPLCFHTASLSFPCLCMRGERGRERDVCHSCSDRLVSTIKSEGHFKLGCSTAASSTVVCQCSILSYTLSQNHYIKKVIEVFLGAHLEYNFGFLLNRQHDIFMPALSIAFVLMLPKYLNKLYFHALGNIKHAQLQQATSRQPNLHNLT